MQYYYLVNISPKAALVASAVVGTLFIFISIIRFIFQTRRPPGFPPGPPTILGLGNLHQIPLDKPFIKFHELSKTYGDIMGLKMGPKNFVILSNPTLMREAFVKRGVKYGGRPFASVAVQHILPPGTQHHHILFTQYDQSLKRWRGAVRHLLTQDAVARQGELMSSLGDKLAYNLLHKPEEWCTSIERWALEMPMLAISGRRLEDYGPGFAEWYLNNQHDWVDFLEPSNLPFVEFLPWLAYMPSFLAAWKQRAARIRKGMREMYFRTLEAAQQRIADGEDRWDNTLYSHILRQREQHDKQAAFSDTQLAFLGGGFLDAALDTTLSSFETLFLCLTAHHDAMRRAREEVDALCGGRMPVCDDIKNLPFLMACFMEALRWRGPASIALPHRLTEDDVLGGYKIPKDTTVIANVYAIHRREEDYDRPNEFIPDRFLTDTSGNKGDPNEDEGHALPTYSFGIGRRVCPGEDFAKTFITTTAAKVLWAFDITTEDGQPPDLSWETGFRPGVVNAPRDFKPKLTPRGVDRARVVAAQFQNAEGYLSKHFG